MRLTRVYVDAPLQAGTTISLPEDAAGHLLRVLRLQSGDACVLFNGDGHDYPARISDAGKRDAQVEILTQQVLANESSLAITLVQAIARGDKMDWIVQKATELGVAAIIPVSSERSEVKLDAQRADKRAAHWRGTAISACEQSGRARIPLLAPLTALADLPQQLPGNSLRLLLDPNAGQTAASLRIDQVTEVVIAIGPEGGWSENDIRLLSTQGFIGMRLGPRVLRTETAGLAAISALQALHGDLR